MKEKTKDEINRFTSPDNCLYVKKDKKLHRVKTPFKVRVLTDIDQYIQGQILTVSKVKCDQQYKPLYKINGKLYRHSYFDLLLPSEF
jgi:hypothetical protein